MTLMGLADYLIDKLQAGRKFTSSAADWDGQDVCTVQLKDQEGDMFVLTLERSSPNATSDDLT